MNILAINTASGCLDVLLSTPTSLFSLHRVAEFGHYEKTLFLIDKVISKARLDVEDLDCLGVCVGPGSFTGIRLGLSIMKALAYAIRKPLVGFKSLDLLAWPNRGNFSGILCIVQDAKKDNIYSAVFTGNRRFRRIGRYSLLGLTDLRSFLEGINKEQEKLYFVGDATQSHRKYLQHNFPDSVILNNCSVRERAVSMLELVKFNLNNGRSHIANKVQPFYLYPRYCQVKSPLK